MSRIAWLMSALCLLAAPLTAGAAALQLSDVRIAMEVQEGSVLVKEMFNVQPTGKDAVANAEGLVIPGPAEAEGADLAEDMPAEGITMTEGGVRIEGEIPPAGRQVALLFLVPIRNGEMTLSQDIGIPVNLAHAALVGDMKGASLSGNGFGGSDMGETQGGLPARFIVGKGFNDGRIRIVVSGLGSNWLYLLTSGLTILSFLILSFGLLRWLKGRISKDPEFA